MPRPSKKGAQKAGGGRDPETGRFVRGYAGGPGRPEGSRNGASLVLERMLQDDGERVVRATIEAALGGDVQAQRIILDRIVPARKSARVPLPTLPPVAGPDDLPNALAALVGLMAAGELSADEAQGVAAVLELHRRAAETGELTQRIARLEERLALSGPPPQPEEDDEP